MGHEALRGRWAPIFAQLADRGSQTYRRATPACPLARGWSPRDLLATKAERSGTRGRAGPPYDVRIDERSVDLREGAPLGPRQLFGCVDRLKQPGVW